MKKLFKIAGFICFAISGILGLFGSMALISSKLGFLWAVAAFILAPATLIIAPWYAWLSLDDPSLLVRTYGFFIASMVFFAISD